MDSGVSTQLAVPFDNAPEPPPPPRLEEDSRDALWKGPVVVNPMDFGFIWAPLWAASGKLKSMDLWQRLLIPVLPGVSAVRLYGDMRDKWEFHLSEPRRTGLAKSAYVLWPFPGNKPTATGELFDMGIVSDTVTETLGFSRSAKASLNRRPEGLPTVLYASRFFDARGVEVMEIPKPDARAPWSFIAKTEVVGSLTVRYTACYRRIVVHYGLPDGPILDIMKELWVAGGMENFEIPPVGLFAVGSSGCAQADIQRNLWPRSMPAMGYAMKWANDNPDDKKKDFVLTETGRETATRRVYDPNDRETYLDVSYATRVTLSDPEGKTWQLKLSGGGA